MLNVTRFSGSVLSKVSLLFLQNIVFISPLNSLNTEMYITGLDTTYKSIAMALILLNISSSSNSVRSENIAISKIKITVNPIQDGLF